MKTCLVCGSELNQDDFACSHCRTNVKLLARIHKAAGTRRFLFGKSPPPRQMSAPPPKPEWQPPRRRTPLPRKKSQASEPGLFDPPKPPPRREMPIAPELDTQPPTHRPPRVAAFFIDTLLCLGLNALVLQLILLFTRRDIANLMKFSLLPMMFVFLAFTILYFWLFSGLFHKSLGLIIAEGFLKQGAQKPKVS